MPKLSAVREADRAHAEEMAALAKSCKFQSVPEMMLVLERAAEKEAKARGHMDISELLRWRDLVNERASEVTEIKLKRVKLMRRRMLYKFRKKS